MAKAPVVTPIEEPGLIELLLPTRGRPQQVFELLKSLEMCTTDKSRLTVACCVDADDSSTIEFFKSTAAQQLSFRIEVIIGPQTDTQGERYNILREQVRPYPEFYMPMADDVVFTTNGWDSMVRDLYARYDDKIVMCFPLDSTVPEGQATYTILHADWTNITGRFSTEIFPFWYEDSWVDEVSFLIGRRELVPFKLVAPDGKGKTQGMRNLIFWERFYHNCFEIRQREAEALLDLIRQRNPAAFEQLNREFPQRLQRAREKAMNINEAATADLERSLTNLAPGTPPGEKYMRVETRAVWELTQRLYGIVRGGNLEGLQSLLLNLAHASPEVMA